MYGPDNVRKFVEDKGIKVDFISLPEGKAATSELAARSVGCPIEQIAKNIVLVAGNRVFLVIISGDKKVDLLKVSSIVKADVKLANPSTVLNTTGYPVGGVPPFAHKSKVPTIIDRSVKRFDYVVTSGGSRNTLIKIGVKDLLRVTEGTLADVSK